MQHQTQVSTKNGLRKLVAIDIERREPSESKKQKATRKEEEHFMKEGRLL